VLHQLEEAGYLSRLNRVVNGKVRKYYVLSRRGGLALTEAREKEIKTAVAARLGIHEE